MDSLRLTQFRSGLISLFLLIFPLTSTATIIRLETVLGVMDIQLYDEAAPKTVENFYNYLNSNAYHYSFFHRSIPGFIIQGGGYVWNQTTKAVNTIEKLPPVVNEFSVTRSNVRGTIAMAKLPGKPNSATSDWFINLADNSANLNKQNEGFTVFGQVLGNGMQVADAIAALPQTASSFSLELPIIGAIEDHKLQEKNLVIVSRVTSNKTDTPESDSDRLFSYLESFYSQYLSPANPLGSGQTVSATFEGYYYRYYPTTQSYVGTSNGEVYYLGPASGNQIISIGSFANWFEQAVAAGY
ncbi:MAG: peptidylprolyl isomerase [Nitrosomonas sp.]|nr:peptidylprolyl isomerase [Nitrosomonas sp.]MBK7365170.1 peptidylprolyl isomerase [Nitrosomonas sp.]